MRKQESHKEEDSPKSQQKDHRMKDSDSDSKISLSCWWSRGPSGQVQEWEPRPTTTQRTVRSESGNRAASKRWGTNSKNSQRAKS